MAQDKWNDLACFQIRNVLLPWRDIQIKQIGVCEGFTEVTEYAFRNLVCVETCRPVQAPVAHKTALILSFMNL